MNFVLPRSICVLLEIHFREFVLFDIIICLYYWNFNTSWNQIDGTFKNNSIVYDGFSNHEH
jgi:hypothetical protein